MRHMFTLSPRRLGRSVFAPAAVALTVLACLWVFDSARTRHAASDRVARASLLQTAIDLARDEQDLVAANKERYTSARAREIDADSGRLMQLLRTADHAWGQGRPMRGLSSKYGADILLAHSPSRAKKARSSLAAVASAASSALATERVDALADQPRQGILVDIEIGAAALAAIEGPLLLFWVVRRHRRRVERHHQRRVDQLSAQARTDTLTRLGNRRAFEDDLGTTIATRAETAQPFTLMAVDLDGLKRINDRNGSPGGRRADPEGRGMPARGRRRGRQRVPHGWRRVHGHPAGTTRTGTGSISQRGSTRSHAHARAVAPSRSASPSRSRPRPPPAHEPGGHRAVRGEADAR